MKKLFLTALMCVLTMSTFAQIKSFEVKGNLRGDFGLGVGPSNVFAALPYHPSSFAISR